jgi:hypothetical protein
MQNCKRIFEYVMTQNLTAVLTLQQIVNKFFFQNISLFGVNKIFAESSATECPKRLCPSFPPGHWARDSLG